MKWSETDELKEEGTMIFLSFPITNSNGKWDR